MPTIFSKAYSIVSTMVMLEPNQGYVETSGLERILCRVLVKRNSRKAWISAMAAAL